MPLNADEMHGINHLKRLGFLLLHGGHPGGCPGVPWCRAQDLLHLPIPLGLGCGGLVSQVVRSGAKSLDLQRFKIYATAEVKRRRGGGDLVVVSGAMTRPEVTKRYG